MYPFDFFLFFFLNSGTPPFLWHEDAHGRRLNCALRVQLVAWLLAALNRSRWRDSVLPVYARRPR